MQYRKHLGIILKKQNFREADQIATLYTRELGKIRFVAKSIRKPQSKLSGAFQDLSLVSVELSTSRSMPILISTKTVQNFAQIKTDLSKTAIAFYACELVIKLTADEQANEPTFDLLHDFLQHLNQAKGDQAALFESLDNFALRLMSSLGFSIEHAHGTVRLPANVAERIHQLRVSEFGTATNTDLRAVKQVHKSVSQFVEYVLERSIKSESFLTSI